MTVSATTTIISVHHVELHSPENARVVHDRLLATLPRLDPELPARARAGDAAWVERERADGPPLWLFEIRDHGALLAADGERRLLWQYEIGNPLTAESMTRYRSEAGLYAPLRIVLRELAKGGCAFSYDLPSDLFGQFGDARVTAVGHDLDREIDTALRTALGEAAGGAARV